jgi:hypothetical protein
MCFFFYLNAVTNHLKQLTLNIEREIKYIFFLVKENRSKELLTYHSNCIIAVKKLKLLRIINLELSIN